MECHPSAHKHGIDEADIAHAVTHHLYAGEINVGDDPPWRVLYLGPDRAANMLEVVVIERDDGSELAIHAMKTRGQYQRLLPGDRNRNDE